MKVCIISQEYPPEAGGGIATQTYLKAHGLSARGHEVHVVCATWNGSVGASPDKLVTVHRIPYPNPSPSGAELSTAWLSYSAAVAAKLHELTGQIPFDIYQFPEYGGEGFVYLTDTFTHQRNGRYVVQMHGPMGMFVEHMGWPERDSALAQVGCFMERMSLRCCDGMLASSRCSAAFCAKAYGIELDKVCVIHSGVNTQRFAPRPQPPDDRSPRVLFVGNLADNKGLTALTRAVLNLRGRFPKIHLRAIGNGDDEYVKDLRTLIARADGKAHVEVKGFVPYGEVPDQYAWCDFFAGPSVYEPGPGNVYLEAMGSGRAVIACDSGGAPEVVVHGRTGLLVKPCNQAALEGAMVELASDAGLRERLGRQGRLWIEEGFALDRYTDKVERFYKGMLP